MKQIVELEDHGQDFLRFHIENGVIVDAAPFQGWLWKGFRVIQKRIARGMRLRLQRSRQDPAILKYPVVSVKQVDEFPVPFSIASR